MSRRISAPVAILALCTWSAAQAAPGIVLLPTLGTPERVTIAGRVLKEAPAGSSRLSRNLRRLTASNWEGAPVEVTFAGRRARVFSGHDGDFEATFTADEGRFPIGTQFAEARVPGAWSRSEVEIVAPEAPLLVISDFDDTVAVSHVIDKKKLLATALWAEGDTHPPVPGMAAWYGCFRAAGPARPGFALVSGTPVQFAERTRQFLSKNGFPFFGLYLRDLGPTTLSGYKEPVIRRLLSALPHKVVLVGDSGEKDPEVYAQIRREFPDRIARIYIRDAGRTEDARRFEGMVLFRHPREAAADAVREKLIAADCAAQAFDGAAR